MSTAESTAGVAELSLIAERADSIYIIALVVGLLVGRAVGLNKIQIKQNVVNTMLMFNE